MAFCRVVFPLLVLSVISCYASSKVPVFMWGETLKYAVPSNPLTTYSSDEYKALLKSVVADDPLTVVFIEESLSVEDFSRKNDNGETSFPYLLDNIDRAIYLPNVANPYSVLKSVIPDATETNELTNDIANEITPSRSTGNFIVIPLKDAKENESRSKMLQRHDEFMHETMKRMANEHGKVVGVYTAEYPSWTIPVTKSRVRRATEGSSRMLNIDGLRMVTKNVHFSSGNDSKVLPDLSESSSVLADTSVNSTLTYGNTTLTLYFNSRAGYWFFDNVILNTGAVTDTLYPVDEVFAILGFSYRCAQYVSFSSRNETNTYTISFEDLKVQPFFEKNTTQEFGDSFNCVGFFSAPIWAALFIVFILLSITFYGIMMMLDIRTMDRFDDPKGKTITINAE